MTDRSPRKPIAEWNSLYLGLGGVGVLVLVVALVVGISAIDVAGRTSKPSSHRPVRSGTVIR
ncbi:hypothetical protein R4227_04025 [Gordonia amicalis]|uniref:hypothetical protein n=1 Tax=Gordonia amicalis TaxID=89053 RepID=UPI0029553EDD|nr:hypothetical protein [Gordonia amicalis]MDV7099326.1 hypothetical protein [Gordonia amicalis]